MKELDQYKKELSDQSGLDVVRWALKAFPGGQLALATSFGAEDQVLTHMAASLGGALRFFTLDTGRLYQETYDTLQKTREQYHFTVQSYFPEAQAVEKMVNEHGPNLFYESVENRKLCCGIRKVEPLKRALKGAAAWMVGLRTGQAATRTDVPVIAWDEDHAVYKISPLWNWSEEQVWNFIHKEKIPYNVLQDQGFRSIGCAPCTRAIGPGDDIRAGRWWWENPELRECGIHIARDPKTGKASVQRGK